MLNNAINWNGFSQTTPFVGQKPDYTGLLGQQQQALNPQPEERNPMPSLEAAQAQQPKEEPSVIEQVAPALNDIFKEASQTTGVPLTYLEKVAKTESNNDPHAKAPTSSATGLFQFTNSTWNNMVNKYGKQYGVGLDDIYDPRAQSIMAARLAQDNSNMIRMGLGIDPNNTDLYMAHFLGPAGAIQLLKSNYINPDISVDQVVSPEALKANKNIFYNKDGKPKTVGEVYSTFNKKIGD
jgi:hypothetical protein